MRIEVIGSVSDREIEHCKRLADSKSFHKEIEKMVIKVDGGFLDIDYYYSSLPNFERVRRITGYLTTLRRMNNAKKCEVSDRLSHGF